MDDRSAVAWLHRRAGWGLAPGQLDREVASGVDRVVDRLLDPDAEGVPPSPDPWEALGETTMLAQDGPDAGRIRRQAVGAWLAAMATTSRPLEERVRWFWHGHLVSGLAEVQHPGMMIEQLRTWGRLGLGSFRALLKAATVDPAMLRYLDGATNRVGAVNENYGRELLELFALGVGNYSERDVRAAAVALTGWTVVPGSITSVFVDRRHDATPQRLLGADGVSGVDAVIEVVCGQEACARFVAGALAAEVLGPGLDAGLIDRLAARFRDSDLEVRSLARAILEAGLDGQGRPMVLPPVVWLVQLLRALELDPFSVFAGTGDDNLLIGAGQVPMFPPNVSGWPSGEAWLSTSCSLARCNLAAVIAGTVPDGAPAREAAVQGDVDRLAELLGRPEGFTDPTREAVVAASRGPTRSERGRPANDTLALATALAAPELVIA